jgi:RNA polymerase sigma factor (sigma-70 family)
MGQDPVLSDSELIMRFRNGDSHAFETLLYRHKDFLYSYILAKVKDSHHAEDIFQEVFMQIVAKVRKGQYAEQGKFTHWAKHIARNKCVDYFRRKKTSRCISFADGHEVLDQLGDPGERADHQLAVRENRELIAIAINRLPEDQRKVVVMRCYSEASFREIASLTDCSVNTALGRMRYGLMNMRKMLGEKAAG